MNGSSFDHGLDDVARAGVYQVHADDLGALAAAARDAGLLVRRIDLDGCRDRHALLLRIATVLELPSGTGRNWDGLMDALRDLGWLTAPGYALLFESAREFGRQHAPDLRTLVDILQEAAAWWAASDVPFWAFLALDDGAAGQR